MKNLKYYKENIHDLDVNLKNLLIIKKSSPGKEDTGRLSSSFDACWQKVFRDQGTDAN
jgi:hypothetical protein